MVKNYLSLSKPATSKFIDRYNSLKPPISSEEETKIPITELRIFPICGVSSTGPVDYIDLGPYGLKYDRDIAILPVTGSNLPLKAWRHQPMAKLRQTLRGSVVTLTTTDPEPLIKQGLPIMIQLDLDIEPETIGPWYDSQNTSYQSLGFCGYRYPVDVCHWISVAIDKEVIVIPAESE